MTRTQTLLLLTALLLAMIAVPALGFFYVSTQPSHEAVERRASQAVSTGFGSADVSCEWNGSISGDHAAFGDEGFNCEDATAQDFDCYVTRDVRVRPGVRTADYYRCYRFGELEDAFNGSWVCVVDTAGAMQPKGYSDGTWMADTYPCPAPVSG